MRIHGLVVLSGAALLACHSDPLAGKLFACDPDWKEKGLSDPCGNGYVCVPKQGKLVHGVCLPVDAAMDVMMDRGGGDLADGGLAEGAEAGPDADVRDVVQEVLDVGPEAPDAGPWRCKASSDCEGHIELGPCERAICEVETGKCYAAPDPEATGPCDDHNACTTNDHCAAGQCTGEAMDCDDGNPCTSDGCDLFKGCVNTPLPDGTPCSKPGLCKGACLLGQCAETAKEVCNGKDDDCDGLVDEEGAEGCKIFYFDGDNDGYGVPGSKCLCAKSGNYRADKPGDCDDTDAAVNPGMQEV